MPNETPLIRHAAVQTLERALRLTPRQAEVLHWLAEGKTNQEISQILECSFFTVKNHLKGIFRHLGVPNRVGAAACAYQAHVGMTEPARTARLTFNTGLSSASHDPRRQPIRA